MKFKIKNVIIKVKLFIIQYNKSETIYNTRLIKVNLCNTTLARRYKAACWRLTLCEQRGSIIGGGAGTSLLQLLHVLQALRGLLEPLGSLLKPLGDPSRHRAPRHEAGHQAWVHGYHTHTMLPRYKHQKLPVILNVCFYVLMMNYMYYLFVPLQFWL